MRRISFIAMTLLAFTTVWGQSKVSPFTAHYLRGQQAMTRAVGTPEVVSAYLHTVGTIDADALAGMGIKVTVQTENILTVRLPLDKVEEVASLDFIKYIQLGTPVRTMMDKARPAAQVDKVLAGEGLDMAYTGKGVVVGIIDGGFDYTHPAFIDDATGVLRIKRVWEQGATSGGSVPTGFGYGIELTTEEAILAAGGDVSNQSHGSHVAAIAAGAYRVEENPYYGIAPEADIVLVSKGAIDANSANISDAVAYIYNYADSVGMPCVINMSLGWHHGPHDGSSPFDQVTNALQGQGRVLVGSMGNYGADPVHVSKQFTGAEDSPLQVMVDYKITPAKDAIGGEVDIWGEKGMEFDLQLHVVNQSDGTVSVSSEVMSVSATDAATHEFTLSSRMTGRVLTTTEINPINGKSHAFVSLEVESRGYGRTIGLTITPRSAGAVHAWADAVYTQFLTEVPDGWSGGDKHYTLCEIGGTGEKIISVGAYVSSNTYTEAGSSQVKMTDEELGALATFSSVGPTMDGRMKPDVIAPGTFIASAVNSHDGYKSSYPTAVSVSWNNNIYSYVYMQGTSMAAPFVSGVVATWLQAYPDLDSETIRQVLSKTAVNDEHTSSATCGYGKIDAYAGLKEVLALAAGIEGVQGDVASDVLFRRVPQGAILCFARPVGEVAVQLYDASGTRLQDDSFMVTEAGQTFTLSLDALPRGIYLLRVGHQVWKVAV